MQPLRQLDQGLNAYVLSFDETLLEDLRASYLRELGPFWRNPAHQTLLTGGQTIRQPAGSEYYIFSYGDYPLLWFSSHSALSFGLFERFYQALELEARFKPLVDHQVRLVMYCGFFVIGDRAPKPLWHVDYSMGTPAYTLLTPLFELQPEHGQLLYVMPESKDRRVYAYQKGEAIIFGNGFLHSTEPYQSEGKLRVLLSLTFGTDKWQYWDSLKTPITNQSKYYRQPCGHVAGSCACLIRRKLGKLFFNPPKPYP